FIGTVAPLRFCPIMFTADFLLQPYRGLAGENLIEKPSTRQVVGDCGMALLKPFEIRFGLPVLLDQIGNKAPLGSLLSVCLLYLLPSLDLFAFQAGRQHAW